MTRCEENRTKVGWREVAIAEAAREDFGYATEAIGRLISAVRLNLPGSAQAVVHDADVRYAFAILREKSELRSAVSGDLTGYVGEEDAFAPYGGWCAFAWGDEEVELVATPGNLKSDLLFFSRSREVAEGAAAYVGRRIRSPEGRCFVFAHRWWRSAADLDGEVERASWGQVVLADEVLSGIRGSVERFFEREEAYRELGFAWRRGILLVGPPGTGKTMVMKAVAASRPELPFLYVRDLEGKGEGWEIGKIFRRARELAPAVLAFEDIDGLVNEGNRSVFLNELDGFASNDGLLVIASSNHPERIDEALLKRPSRFDRVFHLGLPDLEVREEYLRRMFDLPVLAGRLDSPEEAARRVAEATGGFTPAHMKEAVLSAALEFAHEETGEDFEEAVIFQVESLRAYLKLADAPGKLGELRASTRLGFGTGG